jgi:hypothetical protein
MHSENTLRLLPYVRIYSYGKIWSRIMRFVGCVWSQERIPRIKCDCTVCVFQELYTELQHAVFCTGVPFFVVSSHACLYIYIYIYIEIYFVFPMAQQPVVGQGLLIIEA